MAIFFSILIPIITAFVLYLAFRHRTVWWELSIPLVASVLFVVIFKCIAISFITSDTEYLSDTIIEARYYEAWDEWIDETCSRPCCCDSDGDNCSTEYYDCSYRRYHSEYWELITSTGWSMEVSNSEYERLVNKFEEKPMFVDMERDYDLTDGDMYKVSWDGSDDKLECVVASQSYENRTQVSKGILKYPDVSKEEVAEYKLYDYPEISRNYKQEHLLGSNDKQAKHNLDILNGRLGPKQELKAFVLIFDEGQTIDAGYKQKDYWGGGNKNEFIVCIGVNSKGKPTWCLPFTWSDVSRPEIEVINFVLKQKKLDLALVTDKMNKSLQTFKRKEFSDYDYIQVEPTTTQIVWCFILTLLINIGLSLWIIKNEFNSDDRYNRGNDDYYNRRKKLSNLLNRRF